MVYSPVETSPCINIVLRQACFIDNVVQSYSLLMTSVIIEVCSVIMEMFTMRAAMLYTSQRDSDFSL